MLAQKDESAIEHHRIDRLCTRPALGFGSSKWLSCSAWSQKLNQARLMGKSPLGHAGMNLAVKVS